jgi:hypothetical protein
MAATIVAAKQEAGPLGQVARVVDTFVAPSATFRDIPRSSAWWLPFVLISLAALAMTVTIDRRVGFDQAAETQVRLNPSLEAQLSDLTPEAREAQMHGRTLGFRYSFYAAPVFVLAIAAAGALVLWGSFNFGLGAQTKYGQWLCLWMYCALPRVLASLITVAVLYFGASPESCDVTNPVGTNLGYYLGDVPAWVRTFLSFADVIGIWVVALLSMGGAIIAKVKLGQAAAVVIGWWLLIVLVRTALAAAF